MSGGLIALYLLVLTAILVINYLIAKEFSEVAEAKGYNESKYLWIPFFLGIIGYLLVIALPNKNTTSVAQSANNDLSDELPEASDELPETKFQKAVSLMESGFYHEAVSAFEDVGEYKDSEDS